MVQLLEDGLTLFHSLGEKKLLRAFINHSDSINDLVLKEYSDDHVEFFTGGKDNTLRIWKVFIGDKELKGMMQDSLKAIDGDLKRVVYIENEGEVAQVSATEEIGIKCLAYNQMRNQLAIGDNVGNLRVYQLNHSSTQHIKQASFIEAHEGKIVAL